MSVSAKRTHRFLAMIILVTTSVLLPPALWSITQKPPNADVAADLTTQMPKQPSWRAMPTT
jgi:hypothetical protein